MLKHRYVNVQGMIDWRTEDIPDALLGPQYTAGFSNAMEKPSAFERAEAFRRMWKNILHPRVQDPLDDMADDIDAPYIS